MACDDLLDDLGLCFALNEVLAAQAVDFEGEGCDLIHAALADAAGGVVIFAQGVDDDGGADVALKVSRLGRCGAGVHGLEAEGFVLSGLGALRVHVVGVFEEEVACPLAACGFEFGGAVG